MTSRSHQVPEDHYPPQAGGVLMVDRYSAYKAMLQVKNGTLILVFCWAHVRRDFVRVGKGWPELKSWALEWLRRIRDLYRWNRQRLAHPADPAAQAGLRQAVAAMRQQLDTELADPALRTPARKVLTSLQEHWSGLTHFVDDPRIPMDNNLSERRLRGPALGRKNYYGSGALWSGRLAAALFSILATLKLWQINPRLWLNWYLQSCAEAGSQAPNRHRTIPALEPVRRDARETADGNADAETRHQLIPDLRHPPTSRRPLFLRRAKEAVRWHGFGGSLLGSLFRLDPQYRFSSPSNRPLPPVFRR